MKNWTIIEKFAFITSTFVLLYYILGSFNFKKEDFIPVTAPILPFEGDEFNQYWYQGKAEVSTFELTQARYGELRNGYATLVYVTEDFLPDKQVKNELEKNPKAVSVLKLNFIKKFVTGIYDYALMTSIFTPVNLQPTFKVSSSVQEWCGHTYQQINLRKSNYEITTHSYFENEADEKYTLKATLLEDELWTKIRISPNTLPTGEINLIPSTMLSRFKHQRLKIEKAIITLSNYSDNSAISDEKMLYEIKYPAVNRNLKIIFEKKFPHKIIGWEETYKDGWGENAPLLTTKATLKKSILSDYWTKSKVADTTWRKTLEIER